MARIAGIDLPSNKKVEIGLTYIYGIGRYLAKCIVEEAKIPENKRIFELFKQIKEDELNILLKENS